MTASSLLSPTRWSRLDVLLLGEGLCLRREARQFCRAHVLTGRVPRGGPTPPVERLLTGSVRVSPASVTLDGAPLPYAGVPLHLVMHKPAGYVCSHAPDTVAREGGKSVYSLLPPSFTLRNPGVASVGRLDRDASGLLLFTDNGQFGERLASPKSHAAKTYVCTLDGPLPPPPGPEKLFSSGKLPLLDGAVAKPAVLTRHPTLPHVVSVTLWEGRHHQLRRCDCEARG